jgi:hypothetical protein
MESEEVDLPCKCRVADAAKDSPQNSTEGPTSKTTQISGSPETARDKRFRPHSAVYKKKNLRGFGPLANYADRATAASWRSSTNFCG